MPPNYKNLKVLTPEEARIFGKKGGLVKSEAKRFASLLNASHHAKCKKCPAVCLFKKANIDKLKNHLCTVPEARAKSIYFGYPVMSKEVIEKLDSETLLTMASVVAKKKKVKDLKLLHDAILNKKKADYPSVQQVNIDQRILDINVVVTDKYDEIIKRLIGNEGKSKRVG